MRKVPARPSPDISAGAAAGRQILLEGRTRLRRQFYENNQPDPATLLSGYARLTDNLLHKAWQEAGLPELAALIAVGGYGRSQLFPGSDIDLLVLLPSGSTDETRPGGVAHDIRHLLEQWVSLLWDMGLEAAHSVRTLQACEEEAAKDITVQTSLLEARLLAGNPVLFDGLARAMQAMLDPCEFFTAKQFEQQQRHRHYHDTTRNLEPNLKEGPGGLRDLQNILWISRAAGFGQSWQELARNGLITPQEALLVQRQETILQDLRIRLHYLASRREDRLLFDYQTLLARELDIPEKPPRHISELLMQRYYRAAKAVMQINTILLVTLRARIFPDTKTKAVIVNEHFQKQGELLEIRNKHIFRQQPGTMLEGILLLQQSPELKAFGPATLRALWRAAPLIDAGFRNHPHHQSLFMQILRQPRGVTHALRYLNHHGILGRYIPAFGRIVGQMQHDLFHVYTVDEHILMVVRNLRRFTIPEFVHEFPLCSQLAGDFERPEVLYLAGLFHDIAKGRNGDHSTLGRIVASRFCKQHALSTTDTKLVTWLVEHHLLMSVTAQKQDLSDPRVIAGFTAHIVSERYLVALYLLTVADIRATSPKVWNTWKSRLLEELFQATRRHLDGSISNTDYSLESRTKKILALLPPAILAAGTHERVWPELGDTYLLQHDPQEVAWHTTHLDKAASMTLPLVKARFAAGSEGLQVMIYIADQKDLFACICRFFERTGFSIVTARIYTTPHGYALDSFLVLIPPHATERYPDILAFIEQELTRHLKKPIRPEPIFQKRLSRRLRHFPVTPEVSITPDENGIYYLLSITAGDQPGLLSRITQTLARLAVTVHSARINTMGERAEDTFLITGNILHGQRDLIYLETELLRTLRIPGITDPGKTTRTDPVLPFPDHLTQPGT